MPGFDGTGPRGQGAMTGGGRGYCAMAVNNVASNRGRRHCFNATGIPGWMRAQRGMRAFGGYGRAVSAEERAAQA